MICRVFSLSKITCMLLLFIRFPTENLETTAPARCAFAFLQPLSWSRGGYWEASLVSWAGTALYCWHLCWPLSLRGLIHLPLPWHGTQWYSVLWIIGWGVFSDFFLHFIRGLLIFYRSHEWMKVQSETLVTQDALLIRVSHGCQQSRSRKLTLP